MQIKKIKKLEKCKVMTWFDTGIQMICEDEEKGGKEEIKHTFSGFENRDDVFERLESIWQAQSPHADMMNESPRKEEKAEFVVEKIPSSQSEEKKSAQNKKEAVQPPETGTAKVTPRAQGGQVGSEEK